jgi:aryl carrier-like protein
VVGPELVANLQEQVAHLLRCSPEEINPRTALIDTGLDSMAMVQLGPVLRERYGLYVADEHLFNSGFTIEWMLANQAALRAPYLGSLEPVAFAAAASQVPIPPHDAATASSGGGAGASRDGVLGVGAAGAGASGANGVPAVGGPGVAPTSALPPRRRHQPSWFERNFPCCAWCF